MDSVPAFPELEHFFPCSVMKGPFSACESRVPSSALSLAAQWFVHWLSTVPFQEQEHSEHYQTLVRNTRSWASLAEVGLAVRVVT